MYNDRIVNISNFVFQQLQHNIFFYNKNGAMLNYYSMLK